ncbi:MAG TPA: heavy metal translocating P-type ATPase [Pseudonocardiaceae bacterium]|jgi:heavy metal translocating P-type ATPase|nr:heavy metal translocating P-type ATPase [Pseudonocardiaceae bacterium]
MTVVSSPTRTVADERTDPVELAIGGMTCAACAARVERKLNKLDGVTATVNLATEKATVRAPGIPVADLIGQVERAGYQAALIEPAAPAPADPDADRVRSLWHRLVVALLLGGPAGDLSITLALVPSLRFPGWQWLLLVLAAPVVTWCAWPFHRKALAGARHGTSSMDTLVSLGIIAATGWSLYTVFGTDAASQPTDGAWGLIFRPGGSVYLEVAAGVTIFVLAGRLFEAKAKHRAGGALRALAALGAKDVRVLGADGQVRRVPVEQLRVGDTFVVRPGETIATDGEVIGGACAVDTSTMTGESVPVEVAEGDQVTGGTVTIGGRLVVRAERVGRDTQLAQLVALVERAQTDKSGIQRLADRISSVFVPVVLGLAVLTLVGWLLVDGSVQHAVSAGLAVLIIACPCALGLATPTALLVASGRGAQLGVFIKGHQALETARAIDTVILDKTGTLTAGRMAVTDLQPAEGVSRVELLRLAGAVEEASEHVVAAAITERARLEVETLPPVEQFTSVAGLGAGGVVAGQEILLGSARLLAERGVTVAADLDAQRAHWERAGHTTVLVAGDGVAIGAFALADTVKPSAAGAVAQLRGLGLRTVLLTGDNAATARAVGAEVGVDEVVAEVLPADKAAVVQRLQQQGRAVAMVGDGVNDGPALARADLGLAVVTGTDVALGAADVILVRDGLDVVPTAIRLARATLRTIRGNLVWAFGYNLAAVPLAAFGLLNPLIAGAAMALSSLFVVSNSLRLRRFGR